MDTQSTLPNLTLSGQVADFGMTKQLEPTADQTASHSPRMSLTMETTPTAMMTSAFGTGVMASNFRLV